MRMNGTFYDFIHPVICEGFKDGWFIGMMECKEGWWTSSIRKGTEWPRTKDIDIHDFLRSLREIEFEDGGIDEMHIDYVDPQTFRLRVKLSPHF